MTETLFDAVFADGMKLGLELGMLQAMLAHLTTRKFGPEAGNRLLAFVAASPTRSGFSKSAACSLTAPTARSSFPARQAPSNGIDATGGNAADRRSGERSHRRRSRHGTGAPTEKEASG